MRDGMLTMPDVDAHVDYFCHDCETDFRYTTVCTDVLLFENQPPSMSEADAKQFAYLR